MRKFYILVKKETKELLTPQVIIPFIVVVIFFVIMGKVIGGEAQKAEEDQRIAVLDTDLSVSSREAVEQLELSGFNITLYENISREEALESVKDDNENTMLVIPEAFEKNLKHGLSADLETYVIMRGFSFTSAGNAESARRAVFAVSDFFSKKLIEQSDSDLSSDYLKNPVSAVENVVIGERSAEANPDDILGFVSSQTALIPIIIMLIIIFGAQMVATAVATEKENKTLETLLSTPISRWAIVTSKMVAAAMVSLGAAVIYMFGFRYYMDSVIGSDDKSAHGDALNVALQSLDISLGAADYMLLAFSLFFAILCMLVIATILGAFAEDVKSVQLIITPIIMVVLIPYFIVMFIDINSASPVLKFILYLIPFSHPFLAAPNLFMNKTGIVIFGILYQMLFFFVFVHIAGKVYSSDRVLTMKLRSSRKMRIKESQV